MLAVKLKIRKKHRIPRDKKEKSKSKKSDKIIEKTDEKNVGFLLWNL